MALNSEKAKFCKGKSTAAKVKVKFNVYVRSAVSAGNHTKAEAEKIGKKILTRGCTMTSSIAGKKKRKSSVGRKKVSGKLTMTHMAGKKRSRTRRK